MCYNYKFFHSFNCEPTIFNLDIVSWLLMSQKVDYCETGFQPLVQYPRPS